MALYEFYCEDCKAKFEQIIRSEKDPELGKCPKCHKNRTKKLISTFKVGGRGDLRETTMHGCHEAHVSGPNEEGHAHHDHDHDHGDGGGHDDHDH